MGIIKPKVRTQTKGFTVVELIIVISVIAILATITIVGYSGWKSTALATQVKNDLNGEAAAMESYLTFNNAYPTSLSSLTSFKPSSDDVMTLSADSTTTNYCIEAYSKTKPAIAFYIASETKDQGPLAGNCAGRPGGQGAPSSSPSGLAATTVSNNEIDLTWTGISGSGVTYTIQRATDSSFVYATNEATQSGTSRASTGLSPGTTYFYRVEAVTSGGTSAWSNTSSATTQLQGPSGLAATTLSGTSIGYSFSSVAGAVSYNIQKDVNPGFTSPQTHSQSTLTGSFTGLGTATYYFRVQAVDANSVAGLYSATVTASTQPITILIVAGGGGGGGNCASCGGAGGGGAGGLIYSTGTIFPSVGSVSVTVGNGGAGGAATNTAGVGDGSNGANSAFGGLTAIGGGSGRAQNASTGGGGGSGGGGSGGGSPAPGAGGAGTAGQGNGGGSGNSSGLGGGSGGGAGGAGGTGAAASGGVGLAYSISGVSIFYAGGGGAGSYGATNSPGLGGSGGGGSGVNTSINGGNGYPGAANTGGGGGGAAGAATGGVGGTGGSGIVVISYPTGSMTTTGGTVTTSGGNTIVTFRGSGTFTIVSIP